MAARLGSRSYSTGESLGGLPPPILSLNVTYSTQVAPVGVRDPASSPTLCTKVRPLHLELRGDIERYCLTQYKLLQGRSNLSSANVKLGQ